MGTKQPQYNAILPASSWIQAGVWEWQNRQDFSNIVNTLRSFQLSQGMFINPTENFGKCGFGEMQKLSQSYGHF
jgi:hypothetical protein